MAIILSCSFARMTPLMIRWPLISQVAQNGPNNVPRWRGLDSCARKQPTSIRWSKWHCGELPWPVEIANFIRMINYNIKHCRCQIGDRHFPTLIAAQRIKNQIYSLFASKEETLRHSALCIYDLADINRQMRNAEFLDAYGKAQPWPPASLPKQRHPFTCADITDESREWLSENSHFSPVIVGEAQLVAPPHKFGHFTTMLIDQIDGQIPVLFFGTNRGHVLKVGAFKSSEIVDNGRHYSHDKGHSDFAYRLIEAVNVTQFTATCDCHDDPCTEAPCEVIKELKFIQQNQSAPKHIIVAFNNCLVKIPVATCHHDIACCDRYVVTYQILINTRSYSDPYCHTESAKCMPMGNSRLKTRLRPFKACSTKPIVNTPCAVGNLNSYGNVKLFVSGGTQRLFRLCQFDQNLAGKTVAGPASRFEEGEDGAEQRERHCWISLLFTRRQTADHVVPYRWTPFPNRVTRHGFIHFSTITRPTSKWFN